MKKSYVEHIGGAMHDLGGIKVRWVFDNKYIMCYQDGRQVWTTTFRTIRHEAKRISQLSLF